MCLEETEWVCAGWVQLAGCCDPSGSHSTRRILLPEQLSVAVLRGI
jgi:hypothetical protein